MTMPEQSGVRKSPAEVFNEAHAKLTAHLEAVSLGLGVPRTFVVGLFQEDDWSLVVKGTAPVEASISALLLHAVSDQRLHGMLRRASLQGRDGKIELAKTLGVLTGEEARFALTLASLRSRLLHDVRNVSLTENEYFVALTPNKRAELWDGIFALHGRRGVGRATDTWKFEDNQARFVIWTTLVIFLGVLHGKTLKPKAKADYGGAMARLANEAMEFVSNNADD